ncbi:MAG: hypothetical protein ACOCVR_01525 [Myxococcota bacterium]
MRLDLSAAKWVDEPGNPLIEPPRPHWMIADPTVVSPADSPDSRWHLVANSVGFLNHFVSDDGLSWDLQGKSLFRGFRPHLFKDGEDFLLLYELHVRPWLSGIYSRRSRDFRSWSEPRKLLGAERNEIDGRAISFAGNPCLVKAGDEYRLYFSSGWVFLRDCLYFEPRYIGLAVSDCAEGPYERRPGHLIGPDPGHPLLNMGAGSLKLLSDGGSGWWVFQNGIFKDAEKRSRSAIFLHHSEDGVTFESIPTTTIIGPEPGWKRAFVYAFDPVLHGDELRLYYNARDGWLRGRERIGMARAVFPA